LLRIETLRGAHELECLRSRWEWLERHCEYTLFQSYELNRRAAEWFAARETAHVVFAESDSGLAIIPAVRRERELGLIGETLFDYRDVLSAGAPEVLAEAWHELARLGLPLEVTALRGGAVRSRWQPLAPFEFCNAPMIRHSQISAEEFASAHRKSAKASRRLAREGLRLTREPDGARQAAEWLYRRKTEWRGASTNLFLDGQRQDFMLNILNDSVYGCSSWRYLSSTGEIAAVLVSFDHSGCRHFYTIHHDPLWDRFSPGQVMIFDVACESLREGLDVDFMTGECPYKNRLATTQIPLYRVHATVEQMAGMEAVVLRSAA
jgi:CelD/BcsL family acetyltransferase involved in cellulose biosynthesis